jgi:hypothetical protein
LNAWAELAARPEADWLRLPKPKDFQNVAFDGGCMLPTTRSRVPMHTFRADNAAIERRLSDSLDYYARNRSRIDTRLRELDREWDIERAIELNASALAFAGIVAGIFHDKRWLALPAAVTAFLFQHAVQGWCPPVPVLRKMGFRTVYEIEKERRGLKYLRGDFGRTRRSRPKRSRKTARVAKRRVA